jgi:hypothetical protein
MDRTLCFYLSRPGTNILLPMSVKRLELQNETPCPVYLLRCGSLLTFPEWGLPLPSAPLSAAWCWGPGTSVTAFEPAECIITHHDTLPREVRLTYWADCLPWEQGQEALCMGHKRTLQSTGSPWEVSASWPEDTFVKLTYLRMTIGQLSTAYLKWLMWSAERSIRRKRSLNKGQGMRTVTTVITKVATAPQKKSRRRKLKLYPSPCQGTHNPWGRVSSSSSQAAKLACIFKYIIYILKLYYIFLNILVYHFILNKN